MKKHLLSFLLLVAPISLITINAQKTLDQGTIKMEITKVGSEDAQTAQMLEMMKGTSFTIIFKGEESITKTSMMGGMVNTDIKMDKVSGKFDMYMDMMGQKMWIESTLEEASKSQGQVKAVVEAVKSDTKDILGYNTYRVNIKNSDTPEMKISAYVTEDVKAPANGIQGLQSVDLPGFPLMVIMESPQMSMTMETKELSDKMDDSSLTVDTGGYKKMTMEEFQKSMGGMGGGMGF